MPTWHNLSSAVLFFLSSILLVPFLFFLSSYCRADIVRALHFPEYFVFFRNSFLGTTDLTFQMVPFKILFLFLFEFIGRRGWDDRCPSHVLISFD